MYEPPEDVKARLLQMCGMAMQDPDGNENKLPEHVHRAYSRYARCLFRVRGPSEITDETLALVVMVAEELEEARTGKQIAVSNHSDDPEQNVIDLLNTKKIKVGDTIIVHWKEQDHVAKLTGAKRDRSAVKVMMEGDEIERWVNPTWCRVPETVSA